MKVWNVLYIRNELKTLSCCYYVVYLGMFCAFTPQFPCKPIPKGIVLNPLPPPSEGYLSALENSKLSIQIETGRLPVTVSDRRSVAGYLCQRFLAQLKHQAQLSA
jgi:hypothetical protein